MRNKIKITFNNTFPSDFDFLDIKSPPNLTSGPGASTAMFENDEELEQYNAYLQQAYLDLPPGKRKDDIWEIIEVLLPEIEEIASARAATEGFAQNIINYIWQQEHLDHSAKKVFLQNVREAISGAKNYYELKEKIKEAVKDIGIFTFEFRSSFPDFASDPRYVFSELIVVLDAYLDKHKRLV